MVTPFKGFYDGFLGPRNLRQLFVLPFVIRSRTPVAARPAFCDRQLFGNLEICPLDRRQHSLRDAVAFADDVNTVTKPYTTSFLEHREYKCRFFLTSFDIIDNYSDLAPIICVNSA